MVEIFERLLFSFFRSWPIQKVYSKWKEINQARNAEEELKKITLKGEKIHFNGKFKITAPRGMVLGSNIHIGENAWINATGGVFIGDNTHLSRNVTIYSSSHNYEGNLLPYDSKLIIKPVFIGKNVWVGMNTNILPGIKVGDGAIIGMGSTVTKDVPPLAIVGGNPAKIIGNRDKKKYQYKEAQRKYGGINGKEENFSNLTVSELHKKVFFIVGTGRSGSHAIVEFLNQSEEIRAYHEPIWRYLSLSVEKEIGLKSSNEIADEIRFIYKNHSFTNPEKFYVESDQKLSNLIPELNRVLPDSRFIWMIRRPEKFIRSAVARGWFTEPSYESFKDASIFNPNYRTFCLRISADILNEITFGNWEQMSQVDRCAWYWYYWNNNIFKQLNEIDKSRWILIDIDNPIQNKTSLSDFFGLDFTKQDFTKTNVVKRKDKKVYKNFKISSDQSVINSLEKCNDLYINLSKIGNLVKI